MIATSTEWLAAIDSNSTTFRGMLAKTYGSAKLVEDRLPLIRSVVETFLNRFGDLPVRIVRCPGRINLRGMHVDTHGGYLNLMTHQREVVVVSAESGNATPSLVNVDDAFPKITVDCREWTRHNAFSTPWRHFISQSDVQEHIAQRRGHWANYIEGSILRAQHEWKDESLRGICAAVGSDIPRGASLSSSTALSLAVFMSMCAWNGKQLSTPALVPIAQDIEWFTGARIGTSDQSAMLLPGAGEMINFAPNAKAEAPANLRRIAFPEDLTVLVINSHTERSLSGAEQLNYTRNRFAYSLALEILRQEMLASGVPYERAEMMSTLSAFSSDNIASLGGVRALYRWLLRIPRTLTLPELRTRYKLPSLDETYARYFGPLPEHERPTSFEIRGPLLFGIAESERARLFMDAVTFGDHETTGYFMTLGHDGDRRFDAAGNPWSSDVDDATLQTLAARETPIVRVPGAYGASSRALDALVDCAIHAGAAGASLTGAGIAGTVIALCDTPYVERIANEIRKYIQGDAYRAIAPKVNELSEQELCESVVMNASPGPAGELCLA